MTNLSTYLLKIIRSDTGLVDIYSKSGWILNGSTEKSDVNANCENNVSGSNLVITREVGVCEQTDELK